MLGKIPPHLPLGVMVFAKAHCAVTSPSFDLNQAKAANITGL